MVLGLHQLSIENLSCFQNFLGLSDLGPSTGGGLSMGQCHSLHGQIILSFCPKAELFENSVGWKATVALSFVESLDGSVSCSECHSCFCDHL